MRNGTAIPARRRFALLLGVVAVLGGVLASCESTPGEVAAVRNEVNASRAAAGLPALTPNFWLDLKADLWAQRLRGQCSLQHSRLADGAPPGWRKLGENVGMGGSISSVHVAYMDSPGHRANVLDPAFTQIGTAAVWGDCTIKGRTYRMVFTVHVFMA